MEKIGIRLTSMSATSVKYILGTLASNGMFVPDQDLTGVHTPNQLAGELISALNSAFLGNVTDV